MDEMDVSVQLRNAVEKHAQGNSLNRTKLFAECVGLHLDGGDSKPDYYATEDELIRAEERWGPGHPRIALIVRASDHRRTWPHMRALSETLAAEGIRCATFDHEPEACWSGDKVFNFGGLTLRDSIAAIARADVCVSHDTGPLYAAVAMDVPVVALLGCWPPGLRLEGYRKVTVLDANASLGRGYCHDGGPCDGSQLQAITVEMVAGAVKEAVGCK
jgi:ADP-heptose:LPS heptosyltransferase